MCVCVRTHTWAQSLGRFSILWDPMNHSLPGSSVHEFSRQEYWSGLPFSSPGDLPDPGVEPVSPALAGGFFTSCVCVCVCVCVPSHVRLFVTPWSVTCQDPLSMKFSRQEYWSGLPFPTLGDFPNPWIKLAFLLDSPALAGGFFTTRAFWEALYMYISL